MIRSSRSHAVGQMSGGARPRATGLARFARITARPDQLGGIPCIRGLRIPVATVVGMVADGMPEAEILVAYPDLEAEDIREALRFAAEAVLERALPLALGTAS
jgi:uncharacterized protein (DUF433 family)